jgi:hypothetical protein
MKESNSNVLLRAMFQHFTATLARYVILKIDAGNNRTTGIQSSNSREIGMICVVSNQAPTFPGILDEGRGFEK